MDNNPNSVPSVGTEVENSTNVEVSSVSPNDAKPIVGCSASLSTKRDRKGWGAYYFDKNGKMSFIAKFYKKDLPKGGVNLSRLNIYIGS